MPRAATPPLITPDKRYMVVRGRLWRLANPHLAQEDRQLYVKELMSARRAVHQAIKAANPAAVKKARGRVQRAKALLGERGPVWWTDNAPDYTRHLVRNTPYAEWYHRTQK